MREKGLAIFFAILGFFSFVAFAVLSSPLGPKLFPQLLSASASSSPRILYDENLTWKPYDPFYTGNDGSFGGKGEGSTPVLPDEKTAPPRPSY